MLKSSNNDKSKRRELLSLNRPHNTASKKNDSISTNITSSGAVSQTLPSTCISTKVALPPISTVNEPKSSTAVPDTATTTESLGEYYCPICNENLSNFQTSFSRQRHIETCLANTTSEARHGDDDTLESLLLKFCSFCGKSIEHLSGIHKERHFDQCLSALETEQQQAEEVQRLSTYGGHSIPFLQELDLCPCCHELFPGGGLRVKVRHIKRCAKQRSITMEQLLRKLQWMQWGHLPIPNPQVDSSIITTMAPTTPIQYSVHATDSAPQSHSISNNNHSDLQSDSPVISNSNRNSNRDKKDDNDDDFTSKVLMYKVASWRQMKIKKAQPTEDESIAMALSLSLHEEQHEGNRSSISRRKKRKVDWNVSNIISVEESKQSARSTLKRMLEKDVITVDSLKRNQFPLVTSRVQPIIPHRLLQHNNSPTSTLSLWSQASCVD